MKAFFVFLESERDCPVCMEAFKLKDEAKRLPCQHFFHNPCIDQWLKLVRLSSYFYQLTAAASAATFSRYSSNLTATCKLWVLL